MRKQWMVNTMDFATRMSANKAAAKHGIPPTTFTDCLSGHVKHGTKPPYFNQ